MGYYRWGVIFCFGVGGIRDIQVSCCLTHQLLSKTRYSYMLNTFAYCTFLDSVYTYKLPSLGFSYVVMGFFAPFYPCTISYLVTWVVCREVLSFQEVEISLSKVWCLAMTFGGCDSLDFWQYISRQFILQSIAFFVGGTFAVGFSVTICLNS